MAIRFHALLEKHFPERRVFLRSDSDTRFIRLRPCTQLLAFLGATVVVAWAIVATAIILFVAFMLGAEPAADYSLANRSLLFDIDRTDWSERLLGWSGLDRDKLPDTVPSGTVIGRVSGQAAEELGLEFEMHKITDIRAISGFGVMTTPALVVDGEVKCVGRVPSAEELQKMIQ